MKRILFFAAVIIGILSNSISFGYDWSTNPDVGEANFERVAVITNQHIIERISVSTFGHKSHDAAAGIIAIPPAQYYHLEDTSSWTPRYASSSNTYLYCRLDHIEIDGSTLRYYLNDSVSLYGWRANSDDNLGNYVTYGTLRPNGSLYLEAANGSTVGKIKGNLEIISNDALGGGKFNYFAAPVGSIIPINLTITLATNKFDQNVFNESFSYTIEGSIDFKQPTSTPLPKSMRLYGSAHLLENTSSQYTSVVTFDNDFTREITHFTNWAVTPPSAASVETGLLTIGSSIPSRPDINLSAAFTYAGVTVQAQKVITCVTEEAIYPADSWPMYQQNKKHDGYRSLKVRPSEFTEKWTHSFSNRFVKSSGRSGW